MNTYIRYQPQIDFPQSWQHFSINPLCNTSLQDLSATRLSLQHFSSNPSLRQFSTTLFPTFLSLAVATLLCGNSLQLHHYHKTHDHKTTTKKTPLLQNTTQHSHDTAQHQYNATCFRHNKSTIVNTAQPSQPWDPLSFSLEPKHPTTLCLESGPNLPSFFPPWPSPGPSSSPPSPRTSHWPSWLRGAPHSSRARPSRLSNPSHRWLDHGPTSGGSPLHRWAKRKNEGFWNPGCVD